MVMRTCTTRAFTEDGHSIQITAEGDNILVHPPNDLRLILQAYITWAFQILRTQETQLSKSIVRNILLC